MFLIEFIGFSRALTKSYPNFSAFEGNSNTRSSVFLVLLNPFSIISTAFLISLAKFLTSSIKFNGG
jgi:hypothetical protein